MNGNAEQIERAVSVTLPKDRIPDEAEVTDLGGRFRAVFPVTDQEFASLIRRLHARIRIRMDVGTVIVERDHAPWLSARKASIDPYYWSRFSTYLLSENWSPPVVTTLDTVTDEILDQFGNPVLEGAWKRRGLVMGDVQSGKTATYTALSCKAADSGYRLIILLTGTLESLRRQTQERLDAGFVGLDSSGFLSAQRENRAVGVGAIDQSRMAAVFTSRVRDFSVQLVNQLNFRLTAFQEPILLVVKKNKRILENLETWLKDYNLGSDGKIALPLLLIDDEADNASINVNKTGADPTAINERIRKLLSLFSRSTYVGFTATPFANIFIDPDTTHEMLGNDLFPRDFVYSLEPPTNYIGPAAAFGDTPPTDLLQTIDDAEPIFPAGHKSSLQVTSLPPSLIEALRSFLLSNAVRDLRGEGATHRSMLVNVSRLTDVQMQVARLIEQRLRDMQNDIRNYSRLAEADALRNSTIANLHDDWLALYEDCGYEWKEIQAALIDAALPIVVRAVNQRTGVAALDYAKHRATGLRVVAVGGNSLSRGLTLEGISTSYFFRNSRMYDTLLQMGRWFGYRDNYADVCRIWLTEEAVQWYRHITLATEELRDEIKRMCRLGLTPKDFGLKVRMHPASLIVTARNKMQKSETIEKIVSFNLEGLETPYLLPGDAIPFNAKVIREFIEAIERTGVHRGSSLLGNGNLLWREVPKKLVGDVLRRFRASPRNYAFDGEALGRFIDETEDFNSGSSGNRVGQL